jgi:hypothetical protein
MQYIQVRDYTPRQSRFFELMLSVVDTYDVIVLQTNNVRHKIHAKYGEMVSWCIPGAQMLLS